MANIGPNSRDPKEIYGHVMDARQLVALERITGQAYLGTWCWGERDPNPHGQAAPILIAEFNKFATYIEAQLLVQTEFKDIFSQLVVHFDDATQTYQLDWGKFNEQMLTMKAAGQNEQLARLGNTIRALDVYSDTISHSFAINLQEQMVINPDLVKLLDSHYFSGTGTADRLTATSGKDYLNGLAGNDIIQGGAGDDTYYFNAGDGRDRVYDSAGKDQITFGGAVDPAKIKVTRDATSIYLTRLDANGLPTDDVIQLENFFNFNGKISEGVIESIVFDNGTIWTSQDLIAMVKTEPTESADQIFLDETDNTLSGLGGNDLILGGDGNDTLSGDAGDDNLIGDAGNDKLYGGEGNDSVNGGAGNDLLEGGDGNDVLDGGTGNDVVRGGVGNDIVSGNYNGNHTLEGGDGDDTVRVNRTTDISEMINYARNRSHTLAGDRGNDRLEGFAGAETYLFNRGDGQDVINDYGWGYSTSDKLRFGEGITAGDLLATRDGNDILIRLRQDGVLTGDSIRIEQAYTNTDYWIETLVFSDGSALTGQAVFELASEVHGDEGDNTLTGANLADVQYGHGGNDTLNGGGGNDKLYGDAGDDIVNGGNGDDKLFGGDGNDSVNGGAGNDLLEGGDGNDVLDGGTGNDVVRGGVGNDIVSGNYNGNHTLEGGDGDDTVRVNRTTDISEMINYARNRSHTLAGGRGNDRLEGFAGAETYLFNRGDGQDVINDYGWGYSTSDKLRFGEGITAGDLLATRDGNDILIRLRQDGVLTGDSIRIEQAYTNTDYWIETLVFSDGSTLSGQVLFELTSEVHGDEGDNTLTGANLADVQYGHGGNDTLNGGGGNDKLYGDAGDDIVNGGNGDDKLFGGDGNDSVNGGAGNDLLEGGDGNDVLDGGTGNDVVRGGAGNDLVSGNYNGNHTLEGGDGDDTVRVNRTTDISEMINYARNRSHTLAGGRGNDRLEGFAGAETYLFNRGDGQDVINDYGWGYSTSDKLRFGEGITAGDLLATRDGNDILIRLRQDGVLTGDSIRIEQAYTNTDYWIETLVFSDGSTLSGQVLFELTSEVHGDEGDNTLTGANLADVQYGHGGNDTLNGGGGNDKLYGDAGDDIVNGGNGDDKLFGGDGNDSVNGGAGNDLLEGGDGNDVLDGGTGNDVVRGGAGNDLVSGNYNGNHTLEGGDGDDTVRVNRTTDISEMINYARNRSHTLAGGRGNDRLEGFAGAEAYLFNRGDGQDVINDYGWGYSTSDKLRFGEGITAGDLLATRDGNDILIRLRQDGVLTGDSIRIEQAYTNTDYWIETLVFSDGSTLSGQVLFELTSEVHGDEGDNTLTGANLADVQYGHGGNDTLNGGGGNDKLYGDAGDDIVNGGNGDDKLFGGDGNDSVNGGAGNDLLEGGDGNDVLDGGTGNDVVRGGAGNDLVSGNYNGNHTLEGGDGDDTVRVNRTTDISEMINYARNRSHTLAGDRGNDRLEGFAGAETYLFNRGDGQDVINDYGWGYSTSDKLRFGEGITAGDLLATRDGNDILIRLRQDGVLTGDSIRIEQAYTNTDYWIETLVFSDGSALTGQAVFELASEVHGDEGDNTLTGANLADVLHGHGGNDTLNGGNGNDKLYGDAGNDTLNGGAGNDLLEGGDGNDVLDGGTGNDVVRGGAGNDIVSGNYNGNHTLEGGDGDDTVRVNRTTDISEMINYARNRSHTLAGGRGNDRLEGFAGAETYLFNRGDGQDVINDYGWGYSTSDKLRFGEGITAGDLLATRDGNDILIRLRQDGVLTGDSIRIEQAYTNTDYWIETLVFSDGSTLSGQVLFELTSEVHGDEGDNTLTGANLADVLHGHGGNDTLNGGNGNDKLYGDAGNDTLNGGAGNDLLEGGDGNDVLDGGTGNDVVRGGAGNDLVSGNYNGNHTLEGGDGDDTVRVNRTTDISEMINYARNRSHTLAGGRGNDRLEGFAGAETYLFNRGDGQDVINDYGWGYSTSDKLRFGEGITAGDLLATRDGNDILIRLRQDGVLTGDSIRIEQAYTNTDYWIETLVFSDGSTLSGQVLFELTSEVHGDEGDNTLTGANLADVQYGHGGNDTLNGGGGNDKLYGDAGDDIVNGGNGDDKLFGGDGNDSVNGGAGNDLLEGGDGNDVLDGGTGNDVVRGGAGNDLVSGNYNGNHTLEGGDGDDTVRVNRTTDISEMINYARNRSHTLAGGRGNDRLEGFAGAEAYLFNRGDGQDVINDYGWGYSTSDKLRFGEGITAGDLLATRDGNDILIRLRQDGVLTGDSIRIEQAYTNTDYWIETLVFSDGSTLSGQVLFELTSEVHGDEGDNTLTGANLADVQYGHGGNDTLNGGGGNDKLYGDAGDDIVNGGNGDDKLFGGDGNDSVNGGAGNDLLEGGDGNDVLDGGTGNDVVRGGAGNDLVSGNYNGNHTLEGGDGDDTVRVNRTTDISEMINYARNRSHTLAGGRGNDRLEGFAGAETYLFNRGDGQDVINDYGWGYSTSDKLRFGEGITAGDLLATRDGNDILIRLRQDGVLTGDSIRIEQAYTNTDYWIETLVFSDGSALTGQAVFELASEVHGDEGDNTLTGANLADVLHGHGGNDTLNGGNGNDKLYGDAGNDTLNGGAGNDLLEGGDGNDVLDGGTGNDVVRGGVGNDIVSGNYNGNHTLEGGDGDDTVRVNRTTDISEMINYARNRSHTLAGDRGNDRLEGFAGAETYLFNRGDGQDVINDYGWGYSTSDKLRFGEGITAGDLLATRDGNDILIRLRQDGVLTGDSIRIEQAYTNTDYWIETLVFSDGSTLSGQVLFELTSEVHGDEGDNTLTGANLADVQYGHGGNDTLNGGGGNDKLYGDAGDDTLNGGAGNDLLEGGDGNDVLDGGTGNDTYVFKRGNGVDLICENDSTSGNLDLLLFDGDITADKLWFSQNDNNLDIAIMGTDEKMSVQNWYFSKNYHIEQFKTADGKTLIDSQVQQLVNAMAGLTPPAVGATTLPESYQNTLNQVIVANWK
ncbi:calcium-binding protein [Aeromonas veronii]|uniref:calcium-binding protein n=1 Tax=Aeromonas veronii TaxID=654 RepID=UPI003F78E205